MSLRFYSILSIYMYTESVTYLCLACFRHSCSVLQSWCIRRSFCSQRRWCSGTEPCLFVRYTYTQTPPLNTAETHVGCEACVNSEKTHMYTSKCTKKNIRSLLFKGFGIGKTFYCFWKQSHQSCIYLLQCNVIFSNVIYSSDCKAQIMLIQSHVLSNQMMIC